MADHVGEKITRWDFALPSIDEDTKARIVCSAPKDAKGPRPNICVNTTDYPGINFNELTFEQVQGVAKGAFAQVALIAGAELVIKVASDGAHDHFVREKRIYERLGCHPYILRYYGESKVVSPERAMIGLLLQYHPAGTLAAMLSRQQFPDYTDKTK